MDTLAPRKVTALENGAHAGSVCRHQLCSLNGSLQSEMLSGCVDKEGEDQLPRGRAGFKASVL